MAKFRVKLAQLVRETATVIVEIPDDQKLELRRRLSEVYEKEAGEANWEIDADWGTDEGSHYVLGPAPDDAVPDFVLESEDEDSESEDEDS